MVVLFYVQVIVTPNTIVGLIMNVCMCCCFVLILLLLSLFIYVKLCTYGINGKRNSNLQHLCIRNMKYLQIACMLPHARVRTHTHTHTHRYEGCSKSIGP